MKTKAELQNELDDALANIEKETDPVKAKELLEGAKAIKAKIEQMDENDAELAQLKSWHSAPAQARDTTRAVINNGGGGTATKSNVGVTEIDLFTGKVTQEEGAGVLTGQQLKAMYDPKYSEGFKSWVRAEGVEAKMRGTKDANTAFLEGRDSEGGLFVPPELISGIIRRDPTPTRVVDMVRTIAVGSDQAQLIKSTYDSDDLYSSAVRIYKTGEAQSAKKSDKPQFGLKRIDVHGWTAEITVSKRLLEDTNFDIMGYFAEEFRTANRNMTAQKVLLGTGVGEHWGMITRALAGKDEAIEIVKTGDANLLTWDSLRKIKNRVPEQYDSGCKYLFNKKSTLDTIEGFKDGQGRDLWPENQRTGGENGAPGRLRGYGYALEAFMPDIAANAIPLLFGNFMGYARVFRSGMTIQVLREIEARNGQVVFLVEMREGGDVLQSYMMKALKVAA